LIVEVRARNFLSHADTGLELSEGVNVFVGPNGAGKSSVIDAITFALFGVHSRGRNANLVRRGSGWAEVSVTFTAGPDRYTVTRGIDRAGRLTHAELRRLGPDGPRLLAAGERRRVEAEAVSDQVGAILGMGFRELNLASIVRQGELLSILELRPKELKELINRLIGIEDLDRAYELGREVVDGFEERLRRDTGYSVGEIGRLEAELGELRRREAELSGALEGLRRREAELSGRLEGLRRELDAMEPLRAAALEAGRARAELVERVRRLRDESSRRLEELEAILREAPRRLEEASRAEEVRGELESVRAELERIGAELRAASGEAARAEEAESQARSLEADALRRRRRLGELESRIGELERRLAELGSPREPRELEALIAGLEAEVEGLRSEEGGLLRERGNLEELRRTGVCPTCGRSTEGMDVEGRLSALESRIREVEGRLREAREALAGAEEELRRAREAGELRDRLEELRGEAGELRGELEEIGRRLEELRGRAGELGRLRARIAELELRSRELRSRESSLEGELRRISGSAAWLEARGIAGPGDLERLRSEASALRELVGRIPPAPASAPLESLALDPETSAMAARAAELARAASGYDESRYAALKRDVDSASAELAGLVREIGRAEGELESVRRERARREEALRVLGRAKRYLDLFERIRDRVFHRDGELATGLRDWAMEALSDAATEHMRSFGMGISAVQLREGEDLEIVCYGQSGEMSVEQMSGGERVAVALALRFAMARLVGGSRADFVILDEPTADLDAEHRRRLVELVASMGGSAGPQIQIIVITHDREAFEESSVEIPAIFRFSRGPEGSSVERIA